MKKNQINAIDDKHNTDTDILRIIAAFFVVMIHSSGLLTFSGIVYNSISRFSVPVFVMISGYYMLSHKVPIHHLLQKSGKLFMLMIGWSAIYYIYLLLVGGMSYTGIADLTRYLLTEPVHLWYLYAAIALYLMTPIFYVFYSNANRQEYIYALVFLFLFGSVIKILLNSMWFPTLSVVIDKMKAPYTLGFVFLYLAGGYLRKYELFESHRPFKTIYILAIAGTITTVVGTYELSKYMQQPDLLLSFFSPNVIIAGIGVFLFVKQFYYYHPIKNKRIRIALRTAANCTLSVYLLHPLIIMMIQEFVGNPFPHLMPAFAIPLYTIMVFFISIISVVCFKKMINIVHMSKITRKQTQN